MTQNNNVSSKNYSTLDFIAALSIVLFAVLIAVVKIAKPHFETPQWVSTVSALYFSLLFLIRFKKGNDDENYDLIGIILIGIPAVVFLSWLIKILN